MKTIYPKYAGNFKCIAGACPDTCCAGWEIVIDQNFQKLYSEHPSNAAQKATKAMYVDDDGDVCLRLNNGRCPMLNSDNLCELYIDMGENALCDVCRIYPRYNKSAEDTTFTGISLSCPEAARLILSDLTYGDLNENPVLENETSRTIISVYRFFRKLAIDGDFFGCSELAEIIQSEFDFDDPAAASEYITDYIPCLENTIPPVSEVAKYADFISSLEILTDKWKNMCKNLDTHIKKSIGDKEYRKKRDAAYKQASQTKEFSNIQIYFMYKYLAEAIEYADILTMYKTSYICTAVICEIYAMELIANDNPEFDKMLEIAQLFSKEVEHNEDNMDKLIAEGAVSK